MTDFETKYSKLSNLVNIKLAELIDKEISKDLPQTSLFNAIKYSLSAQGKRLRPVLGLAVADVFETDYKVVLPYLCAIEMIHTYSLIHDDLPSMDNDDYRRGIPTSHKVFGEAVAILTGDALLNYAFEIMFKDLAESEPQDFKKKIDAIRIIAKSAGMSGMIAGQIIDIGYEGKEIPEDLLKKMHELKTGGIIKASIIAPAIICGASEEEINCLVTYSENIGLAFQIRDDILDVVGSSEVMGKSSGSDKSKNKSTFVSVYGLEQSKEKLNQVTKKAISALGIFKEKANFLVGLAEFIETRNK